MAVVHTQHRYYSVKWQSAISVRLIAENISHFMKDHVFTPILSLHPPANDLVIRSLSQVPSLLQARECIHEVTNTVSRKNYLNFNVLLNMVRTLFLLTHKLSFCSFPY